MPEENRGPWSKKFENRCGNESCTVSNWLDLRNACKETGPPKRLYISKAGYPIIPLMKTICFWSCIH